jgi:hypothetical protein
MTPRLKSIADDLKKLATNFKSKARERIRKKLLVNEGNGEEDGGRLAGKRRNRWKDVKMLRQVLDNFSFSLSQEYAMVQFKRSQKRFCFQ